MLQRPRVPGYFILIGDRVLIIDDKAARDSKSRRAPGYFPLIGDKAPPAARDSSEVARA